MINAVMEMLFKITNTTVGHTSELPSLQFQLELGLLSVQSFAILFPSISK